MAQLGRLRDTLLRHTGDPAAGASVTVRRQGATVTSNQSGSAPLTLTVADPGGIQPGDTVANGVSGTTYSVDSIGTSTVTISGFSGTIAFLSGDRLTPTNTLPTLYADARAVNTLAGGNPMATDTNGEFACWVEISPYDLFITGGGYATRLFQDVWPAGIVTVRVNCSPDPNGDGYIFDAKHLPGTGKIIRFQVDGVDKFFVNADGTISGTIAVSVPDPLTLVNGLTVGGLATFNNGAGVIGGLTVDNFTGTGTFTVAAGAIASAALANHAVTVAPVVVRGAASDAVLPISPAAERVNVSTSFTPVGTNSAVQFTYNGAYSQSVSDTNNGHAEVRLYIDGVLVFKHRFGGVAGALGTNTGLYVPVSLQWVATGLTNAAHTIEVRELFFRTVGAAANGTYLGTSVIQSALTIQEWKK